MQATSNTMTLQSSNLNGERTEIKNRSWLMKDTIFLFLYYKTSYLDYLDFKFGLYNNNNNHRVFIDCKFNERIESRRLKRTMCTK